jgi:indole-3-glycerol phosphate synthase
VLNEVQVLEARAAGASAVLLIARVLKPHQLQELATEVRGWDMTPLIEIHAESELDAALAAGPGVLGVNARDLDTFVVDLHAAEALIGQVPGGIPVVAESGVESRADVERLAAAGADLILVGTSVARQANPETAVHALTGVKRRNRNR